MDWFEYFCCGSTFTRMMRHPEIEAVCPRCRLQVKPLVSLHVKQDKGGEEGLALDEPG